MIIITYVRHIHDGGGYYNSGTDGNQYPNWNYQGSYGTPRYHNQVGGWNLGTQYNPIPAPNVGNMHNIHNVGNQTLNNTQMSGSKIYWCGWKAKNDQACLYVSGYAALFTITTRA